MENGMNVRFIIPPMTPEDAVTTVLNTCMHTMDKKLPWDDARILLSQLMEDSYQLGYQKGKEDNIPAPEPIPPASGDPIDKLA
jgi:hypothetical protein